MGALRYSVGFIAGLCDRFGSLRARNAVLALVAYDASTANGFDAAFDIFPLRGF